MRKLAWPLVWALYWVGHWASLVLDYIPEGRQWWCDAVYRIYNVCMVASSKLQDWAGLTQASAPWGRALDEVEDIECTPSCGCVFCDLEVCDGGEKCLMPR